jgi:acrylyl-CoA reductase (NADPH)
LTALAWGIAGYFKKKGLHLGHFSPQMGITIRTAVAILARRGYEVAASTGKSSEVNYLRALGARVILTREEVSAQSNKPLEHGRWAGAFDPVGGATLAYLIRTMKYGGLIASCGLTGGTDVNITVFPFIIRGVSLLGIDSVFCPMDMRLETWKRLAEDIKDSPWLESITQEVTLEEIPQLVNKILTGQIRGRTIVRIRQ